MEFKRVAESLLALRRQVNEMAPGRDTSSDGALGDVAHQARKSDHNPDADGVVTAMDITHDPAHGVDAGEIAEMLRMSRDRRIKYVISNRRIFSSSQTPWVWRPYDGANAHTKHVHISVIDDKSLYDDTRPWPIDKLAKTVAPLVAGTAKRFADIIATKFGGRDDPNKSAYDDHVITDEEFGVALPFHFKVTPRPKVKVTNSATGAAAICEIVDVGPFNTDDPYWETGTRPKAESGITSDGQKSNGAGIDLTPAVDRAVGNNGKGKVDWEFVGASAVQQGGNTMATSANDIASVLQQVLTILQALNKQQPPAAGPVAPTPTPTTPSAQPTDDVQKILAVINAVLNPGKDGTPALGQVNGALGDTIGNLLDGKKTAIGTIGALVTSLLSFVTTAPTGAAGTTGLSGLGQVLAPLIPAAGLSGFAMPIFLALAAWGVLGKLEKWSGNSTPPTQK